MSDRLTDTELDRLERLRSDGPRGRMRWGADLMNGGPGDLPTATTIRSAEGRIQATMDYDLGGAKMADTLASAYNALPALLAEVREHRAREAAHRAALDTLVDGDDR